MPGVNSSGPFRGNRRSESAPPRLNPPAPKPEEMTAAPQPSRPGSPEYSMPGSFAPPMSSASRRTRSPSPAPPHSAPPPQEVPPKSRSWFGFFTGWFRSQPAAETPRPLSPAESQDTARPPSPPLSSPPSPPSPLAPGPIPGSLAGTSLSPIPESRIPPPKPLPADAGTLRPLPHGRSATDPGPSEAPASLHAGTPDFDAAGSGSVRPKRAGSGSKARPKRSQSGPAAVETRPGFAAGSGQASGKRPAVPPQRKWSLGPAPAKAEKHLSPASLRRFEEFKARIGEGLHPKAAAEMLGDMKYTKLRGAKDLFEVRLNQHDRILFRLDDAEGKVTIIQAGGHT